MRQHGYSGNISEYPQVEVGVPVLPKPLNVAAQKSAQLTIWKQKNRRRKRNSSAALYL